MWFLLDKYRVLIESNLDTNVSEYVPKNINIYSTLSSTAFIDVNGILTNDRDILAEIFGGGNTTYRDIIDSVNAANADDAIDKIVLNVGYSPGGNVMGLFNAMDAVRESKKPVVAYVEYGAMSAAYGLVSQAQGGVIAGSRATQFGSVGVVQTIQNNPDVYEITSTEAPDKRPDVATEAGKNVIRRELDGIHNLFVDTIASGRNTTSDLINKQYGRGAAVLARDALAAGMIDEINEHVTAKYEKEEPMNQEELKSKYPELYSLIYSAGESNERSRVVAHLEMSELTGDTDTAVQAIRDGSDITPELQRKYAVAGIKKQMAAARSDDNVNTDNIAADSGDAEKERIAKYLAARVGV